MVLQGLIVEKNNRVSFNKTSLKLATNDLIKNFCFTLDNVCFCQLIGTTIGPNPASFMGNLL